MTMRVSNKISALIVLLILSALTEVRAQDQFIFANSGDILELAISENSAGENQRWQSSTDGANWNDLSDQTSLSVTIEQTPFFFRAVSDGSGCLNISEEVTVLGSSDATRWSEASTWRGNGVPTAGDEVTIASDMFVLLDENTADLGGLTIEGLLIFDRQDLNLTSEWILVDGGSLTIGSEADPFEHKAVITLNDTDTEESVMSMGTRGLVAMNGGSLELFGEVPDVTITKLNADLDPSLNPQTMTLMDSVDWNSEDEFVIGPTDYFRAGSGRSVTKKLTIASESSGTEVSFSEAIDAYFWGRLQYVTADGLSLDPNSVLVAPPAEDTDERQTPRILDERAPVGHLTRNIVIQAPDDEVWQEQGFGAHTMIMPGSTARVDGVEFRRMGQRGRERRYPWHWHMLSYSGIETLPDATGQFVRNSTISHSKNRGIVIHGTNGVEVSGNILYDIEGHGIFTEDAVERRNVIDGNLVLHVRNQPSGSALLVHESNRASGFWISNPDNTITNNHTADCQSFGYWLAFPETPWRLGAGVLNEFGNPMIPNRIALREFDGNVAHSNGENGIMLDFPEVTNDGETLPVKYMSTSNQVVNPAFPFFENGMLRFTLSNFTLFKNLGNGIWDRAWAATNYGVVSADNCGRFFAGSGDFGIIERSLAVGTSFNHLMNGTDRPPVADFSGGAGYSSSYPAAFATYHSTFEIRDNIGVNFELVPNERSGFFSTDDYYTNPVEKGTFQNTNNLMINSHPGVRLRAAEPQFTLAGALHDPNGIWITPDHWLVYDEPFLTYGYDTEQLEAGSGGVGVGGNFYGVLAFLKDNPEGNPFNQFLEVQVERYDVSTGLDLASPIATWNVPYGITPESALLGNMRHFAARPISDDAAYVLGFPDTNGIAGDNENPYAEDFFQLSTNNMLMSTDRLLLGLRFDGTQTDISVYSWVNNQNNTRREFSAVESFESVRDDANGEVYWQDTDNNIVWVQIIGGVREPNEYSTVNDILYEQFEFVIEAN